MQKVLQIATNLEGGPSATSAFFSRGFSKLLSLECNLLPDLPQCDPFTMTPLVLAARQDDMKKTRDISPKATSLVGRVHKTDVSSELGGQSAAFETVDDVQEAYGHVRTYSTLFVIRFQSLEFGKHLSNSCLR